MSPLGPCQGRLLWIGMPIDGQHTSLEYRILESRGYCEMTGLNPYLPPPTLGQGEVFQPDRILEIAMIATDSDLRPLDEGLEMIVRTERHVLDSMNDWCIKQHGKTGLTKACLDSPHSIKDVDAACRAYVTRHFDAPAVIAGNSVHADLGFIRKDLPSLSSTLHYRIVDVSSLKILVAQWYPSAPKPPKEKSDSQHRAMSDIRDSIEELKHYRCHFFVNTDSP
ncbi:BZ3500_MvSof-1268-A1-R1_Chr1-3g01562 [Microbotryum saponariae]|uniref:BZ3500_MvSof-1268-A1-R1_Chr1-3g01562 protein n=1 Tax=Microbotryum saponariae TaxID=289078 RepID=A0A2X0KME3_9BASI|nr:BZ3500_MvSof-1268-A1-R1_Chr1-3g01562 [Microbotryum saponariae]SCZ94037.1 BZ3501_MvSof-1269-A2-R1_Chr1-3g01164 [Microbotryum saponariae]